MDTRSKATEVGFTQSQFSGSKPSWHIFIWLNLDRTCSEAVPVNPLRTWQKIKKLIKLGFISQKHDLIIWAQHCSRWPWNNFDHLGFSNVTYNFLHCTPIGRRLPRPRAQQSNAKLEPLNYQASHGAAVADNFWDPPQLCGLVWDQTLQLRVCFMLTYHCTECYAIRTSNGRKLQKLASIESFSRVFRPPHWD